MQFGLFESSRTNVSFTCNVEKWIGLSTNVIAFSLFQLNYVWIGGVVVVFGSLRDVQGSGSFA